MIEKLLERIAIALEGILKAQNQPIVLATEVVKVAADTAAPKSEATTPKPKTDKKKKEVAVAPEASASKPSESVPVSAPAAPAPAATDLKPIDKVRAALTEYSKKTSLAAAKELMKKHTGTEKLSEAKPETFDAVIAACAAAPAAPAAATVDVFS